MRTSFRDERGFTFVEVFVTLIIVIMLTLATTAVLNQHYSSSNYIISTVNNNANGNKALNRISEEIKYACAVDPPGDGGHTLNFQYRGEAFKRSLFLDGDELYFVNNNIIPVVNVLIARNVGDIQFSRDATDPRVVTINLTMRDPNDQKQIDCQLVTTVRAINPILE